MTDTQEASIESKDDTPPLQSPGLMVRTQRESAGLSQQAISEALHLTVHYIKALENDEYGKLPGLTFVKGYFRAYSRFLGMDVDAVLACYERYLAANGLRVESSDFVPSSGRRGRSDQSLVWALMAGTILVIALAAGWWFFGREFEARSAAVPAPAVNTPAQQQTTPAAATANVAVNAAPAAAFTPPPAAIDTTIAPQRQVAESETALEPADAGAAIINATLEARQEAEALALEEALQDEPDAALGATETLASSATAVTPSPSVETATDVAAALPVQSLAQDAVTQVATAVQNAPASIEAAVQTAGVVQTGALEYVTAEDGRRVITHRGEGGDRLELNLNGSSWTEVKDAQGANVFNNMLRQGDQLVIQGMAPFTVLLGDARQVQASFNAQRVDLSTLIRNDNTARFELGPAGVSTPAFTTSQASATE
ncbi:MAG TPA: RodZ domain-containing protein [Hyphomicrobiales bacterium]|nr:RodZ domain-containing protein [Hyphomicrobiales bacterium]